MRTKKESIVITGGAGGIGTACAKTYKKEQLIITDYTQESVDKAVKNLRNEGHDAIGIACDITNKKDVDKLKQFVSDNGSLKGFIHTAGVSGTVQDLRKIYDIDLVATDILIDAFYDLAIENSVAVILSSMMAHVVPANDAYDVALINPQETNSFDTVSQFVNNNSDTMYNFAKRGVQLVMKKNTTRWGKKGARIVTVSPGVIETEMAVKAAEEHPERVQMIKNATPLQRNGRPEEIANVVHFLTSDHASFITGTDILVDGGVIENIKKMG